MEQRARQTRNRKKQEVPLNGRLREAARASREAALMTQSVDEREALLRAARQYEAAAYLDEWLAPSGQQRST
jgi:hypothetical protein